MNIKFLLICILCMSGTSAVFYPRRSSALSACNYEYAGCLGLPGNSDCSNCTGDFSGRWGYIEWDGPGYCCMDTQASGVPDVAGLHCYGYPECTLNCGPYENNKRYCSYSATYPPSTVNCSQNLKNKAKKIPCEKPQYQCAPGYMWREGDAIDCKTYGELCTCIPKCTLDEYKGTDESAKSECKKGCDNFNKSTCFSKCDTNNNKCFDTCMTSGGGDACKGSCIENLGSCLSKCENFNKNECINDCDISSIGCHKCPTVGNDKSGKPAYGWGVNSQTESDAGNMGVGIKSCRAVKGRKFYDKTGVFEYTSTCSYSG